MIQNCISSTDKKRDTLRKKSRRHQSESPDRKRDKSKNKKNKNDRNDRDKSLKRKEAAYEERKRRQSVNRSRSVSPVNNDSQTVEYVTFESGASPRNSPYPQTGPDGQVIYRHRHPSSTNPDKVITAVYLSKMNIDLNKLRILIKCVFISSSIILGLRKC